jgi:hypothetical protein
MPRVDLARGKAGLAAALSAAIILSSATAALATSASLPPATSLPVPATTAATEPDLAGLVIYDKLVPFTIAAPTGAVLCSGRLQDRVVRSRKTGLYDFYYAIRSTNGPGAIRRMTTSAFTGLKLRVAYRTDGLGTVPPIVAARNAAPGALVAFGFAETPISCAKHQESRFILIKTATKAFHTGGATQILTPSGAAVSVPTVKP